MDSAAKTSNREWDWINEIGQLPSLNFFAVQQLTTYFIDVTCFLDVIFKSKFLPMLLQGLKVVELAGLAPVPFAGMILSDFGATVVKVDNMNPGIPDTLCRGKKSIALNLKTSQGIDILLKILDHSDVLLDPYRPGVLERLGIGPEIVMKRNPKLIYCRLTGFGQDGRFSQMAGHDLNYIAITGVLSVLGGKDISFPGNLLGDFAGGSLFCIIGILMALFERSRSGLGQVIDSNIVDGTAYLASFIFKAKQIGLWNEERGKNLLDSGAPFYKIYETKDGKYMTVGALEPQFYKVFVNLLGFKEESLPERTDRENWPELEAKFRSAFLSKTYKEWCAIFEKTDACVAPVVDFDNAHLYPVNKERNVFIEIDQGVVPAPCPRFSRTKIKMNLNEPEAGQDTVGILQELGLNSQDISKLEGQKVIKIAKL